MNSIEVEGDIRLRIQLARRDDVARVLEVPQNRPFRSYEPLIPDAALVVYPFEEGPPPEGKVTWGVAAVHADQVWEELDVLGDGVVVGIADSAVEWNHPAIIDTYRGGRNGDHDFNQYDPKPEQSRINDND